MKRAVHHAEVVGSMLRPASLLQARERHERGNLAAADLKRAEDRAVDSCVTIQEAAGVDVVSDGEMRRNVFASQLAQAVDGFEAILGNTVDWFHMDGTKETSPVAPEFGMVLDPHQQEWFARKGFEPRRMVHEGIEMMNAIMDEPPAQHAGVTFGLHVCRGNDANRYMAKGSYAAIADEILRCSHAQVLLLEYDDERSGDFAPLARAAEDKTVVLGLVSTKRARVETEDELVARITEASQYVPLERLALSTQCGFASVAKGNNIPFELQDQKLSLVARVARRVWG